MSTIQNPVTGSRLSAPLQGSSAGAAPDWLDKSVYPFQSRYLSLDEHRIHYIDEGSGPLLRTIHQIWVVANPDKLGGV